MEEEGIFVMHFWPDIKIQIYKLPDLHDKYCLIALWSFYTVMVQSLSQGLKPSIMGPSILIVRLGRGEHTYIHTHTCIRLSHLSQNEWAAPCLSASLIWMEELLADLTTLISTPMESVQYSCGWWNTLPGDATLPPQVIQQAEQRLSVMKGQWWEHLFPLWCASKKYSIRTRSAVVKSCNTWATCFQMISKLYRIMCEDRETYCFTICYSSRLWILLMFPCVCMVLICVFLCVRWFHRSTHVHMAGRLDYPRTLHYVVIWQHKHSHPCSPFLPFTLLHRWCGTSPRLCVCVCGCEETKRPVCVSVCVLGAGIWTALSQPGSGCCHLSITSWTTADATSAHQKNRTESHTQFCFSCLLCKYGRVHSCVQYWRMKCLLSPKYTHTNTTRKLSVASCLNTNKLSKISMSSPPTITQQCMCASKDVQTEPWKWVNSLWYRRVSAEINKYNAILSESPCCLSLQM